MKRQKISGEKQKLSKQNQRENLKNIISEKNHWIGLTKEWRYQKFSEFEAVIIIKNIQYNEQSKLN